uniref:hypothetical protein n=1 Tax=Methanolobus psychrotolerans TaxID=1874706 RepID=UPI0013ED41F9
QSFSLIITTKPKVEIYSDKEGANVYVNNEDGFGIADAVIENGVAELCAYEGENIITVGDDNWLSWLIPSKQSIDCSVTKGNLQRGYVYFGSYDLELTSGYQFISLPFNASASTLFSSSYVEKIIGFNDLVPVELDSSCTLEKGHSYLIETSQATTIEIDTIANEFGTVTIDGCGLIGAPSASTNLSDMLINMDYDINSSIFYKYNTTGNIFEVLYTDTQIDPGETLFAISTETFGVNI